MSEPKVSEENFDKVVSELVINREKRRRIQQMSAKELTRYVASIYRSGVEDTAAKISREFELKRREQEVEEVAVDWEDVLSVIRKVAGMTDTMLGRIDTALRGAF